MHRSLSGFLILSALASCKEPRVQKSTVTHDPASLDTASQDKLPSRDQSPLFVEAGSDIYSHTSISLVAQVKGFDNILWQQVSGPGIVTFSDRASASPLVTADKEGEYLIKIIASKGETTLSDNLHFTWDITPPSLIISPDFRAFQAFELYLSSQDADSIAWEVLSGPGEAQISHPEPTKTMFSANADGVYQLRVTAFDKAGNKTVRKTAVTWNTRDLMVQAGPDLMSSGPIEISAQASQENVTYAWTVVSGPGNLMFSDRGDGVQTTEVQSQVEGTYILRVTVTNNVGRTASDELSITFSRSAPALSLQSHP